VEGRGELCSVNLGTLQKRDELLEKKKKIKKKIKLKAQGGREEPTKPLLTTPV